MIYVLDYKYRKIEAIRKYTYAEFEEAYRDIGTFLIKLPLTDENMYLINPNKQFYVLFETMIRGEEGCLFGQIDSVKKDSDEESNEIEVSGRMGTVLFKQRVVKGTFNFEGLTYAFVRDIIDKGIDLLDSTSDRYLDVSIKCDRKSYLEQYCSKISKQVTGGTLWDAMSEILEQDSLGIEVVPSILTGALSERYETSVGLFEIYISAGYDRTKGNSEGLEPVIMSKSLSNIASTSYEHDRTDYANYAYVAGEGEEENRKWFEMEINDMVSVESKTGFGRREIFIDARDIQSEQEGTVLTDKEYEELIKQRANTKSAENTEQKTYESTITEYNQYEVGKDYFLGDWVTVVDDELGLSLDVQVLKITHTLQDSGAVEHKDVEFGYGTKKTLNVIEKLDNSVSKIYNNVVNIKYLDNKSKTTEQKLSDLTSNYNNLEKQMGGFDWTNFDKVNEVDTWIPVMNNREVNHRPIPADEFKLESSGMWYKYGRFTFARFNGELLSDIGDCSYPPKSSAYVYCVIQNTTNGGFWHGWLEVAASGAVIGRTITSLGTSALYECTDKSIYKVWANVIFFNS